MHLTDSEAVSADNVNAISFTLHNDLHKRRRLTVSNGTDWHTAIGPGIRVLDTFDQQGPIWQEGDVVTTEGH